jgi:hypothetical protein
MLHEHYTHERSVSVLTLQDHHRDTFAFLVMEEIGELYDSLSVDEMDDHERRRYLAALALFARLAADATRASAHALTGPEVEHFWTFLRSVLRAATLEERDATDATDVLTRVSAGEHIELADNLAAQLGGWRF